MEFQKVEELLYRLGVNASYQGFNYVVDCIVMVALDCARRDSMKSVYIDTGKKNNTSRDCVERDIRTLLRIIWESGNRKYLEEISGQELRQRPRNRDFIFMMVDYLLKEEEQ